MANDEEDSMNNQPYIKLWMPEDVPQRFRELISIDDDTGVIVLFVAHVPAAVLAGKTYQDLQRTYADEWGSNGWLRSGELGLFGTNALNEIPHPDGDGILLVGSCV